MQRFSLVRVEDGLKPMSDEPEKRESNANEELEREIRLARKFNARDAMARMAGPGAMKGASPVSPVQQAETEIRTWLANNLGDACGSLKIVLCRHLKGSGLLLDRLDRPLAALAAYCEHVLATDYLLGEIVREADVEWGRAMDERPCFEREGSLPDPDDPYTAASVRATLSDVVSKLAAG